jgi:hypothetical protein
VQGTYHFILLSLVDASYLPMIPYFSCELFKTFSWGGCLGNANNFATSEECMATCDRQGKFVAALTADAAKTPARFRAPSRFRATPVVEDTSTKPEVDASNKENELLEAGTYLHISMTLSSENYI